jgi:hypothetical protein
MLGLIDEKIRSPKIDVRHQDALIRLREILKSDLDSRCFGSSSDQRADSRETAASLCTETFPAQAAA